MKLILEVRAACTDNVHWRFLLPKINSIFSVLKAHFLNLHLIYFKRLKFKRLKFKITYSTSNMRLIKQHKYINEGPNGQREDFNMSSTKWTELGINEELSSELIKQGIVDPTEVQQQAIQLLLEGKDISVKSQTGSGKTLAFLLPILQTINVESKAIQAVVLAPTQELAMQIFRVAESYGEQLGV